MPALGGQQRVQAVREKLASGEQALQLHFPGADLGYCYAGSASSASATTVHLTSGGSGGHGAGAAGLSTAEHYVPSVGPGARLPHFHLAQDGGSDGAQTTISSLDAVARGQQGGPTLTLFVPTEVESDADGRTAAASTGGVPAWVESAAQINRVHALALPIAVVHVGRTAWGTLPVPAGTPSAALEALLVRPDGHIAGSWTAGGDGNGRGDAVGTMIWGVEETKAELWRAGCQLGCVMATAAAAAV